MVRGGSILFEQKEWKGTMKMAIDRLTSVSDMRKNAYLLELYMADWVSLVQGQQLIWSEPSADARRARALALHARAANLANELDVFGGSVIGIARDRGAIVELLDASCPVGAKYDFSGLDELRCLLTYAMLRIAFNRILWALSLILCGRVPEVLDVEHETFCRQIWMSLPYARDSSLLTAALSTDPFYLAYEGAHGATKEYILSSIMEISRYRRRLPNDRDLVHGYLLDTAFAMTGRVSFRERMDFPYWKRRLEVMTE
jgi:hypothetical protein